MRGLRFAKSVITYHGQEPAVEIHFVDENGDRMHLVLDEATANSVKNSINHFQNNKRK